MRNLVNTPLEKRMAGATVVIRHSARVLDLPIPWVSTDTMSLGLNETYDGHGSCPTHREALSIISNAVKMSNVTLRLHHSFLGFSPVMVGILGLRQQVSFLRLGETESREDGSLIVDFQVRD